MFNEIFGSQISGYESKPINKISFQENEALINLLREDNELGMEDEEEMRSPECPQGWKSFQTTCYYFGTSNSYLSWSGATSACRDLHENSTLPSVRSVEEDQFLQTNATSHPFWLGASREIGAYYLNPSSWTWSDGTAMNYTAWAREQPNNYWWGERCVRSVESFDRVGEQTWDDHKCWSRNALALVCKLQM
eukprot:TRINITY_DN15387_c0_g1_i4.p1 TRINITY_DN15387_c0_g1~~TRINITY_DN15387_c0_g1_i4.p1  ORF type:complete len:192 (-),score=42.54 TRINITY_DN15387_c0_g1_i4:25-600(-)